MLGPLLGIALEARRQGVVLGGSGSARACSGDRVGRDAIALDANQKLRARADDGELGHSDEEEVRARIDAAQRAVQSHGVQRLPGTAVPGAAWAVGWFWDGHEHVDPAKEAQRLCHAAGARRRVGFEK